MTYIKNPITIGGGIKKNRFTSNPQRGDAVYVTPGGDVKFITLDTLTPSELPASWTAVGVVEKAKDANGDVMISDKNNASYKACAVARFRVVGQYDGVAHDCVVKLHDTTLATHFVYTASDAASFASQLNTYLRNLPNTDPSFAYTYYAYQDTDGTVYIILDPYTAYEGGDITITGCTTAKAMYSEVSVYSTLKSKAPSKHSGTARSSYWQMQNRARCIEFLRTTTAGTYNPATFSYNYPVSLTCYLGNTCVGIDAVRAIYGASEQGWIDYLDDNFTCDLDAAGTATANETDPLTGASRRSGNANTAALANVTYIDRNGVRQYLYPGVQYCLGCNYDAAGLGAGNWFMESLYESMQTDADITYGLAGVTRQNADKVNRCLYLMGGTAVNCTSYRWYSSRYYSYGAWYGDYLGYSGYNYFFLAFTVRRFALYHHGLSSDTYTAYNGGEEELLPSNTATPETSPVSAKIKYKK